MSYVEHNQIARVAAPANATRKRACPNAQTEPLSWGQKRTTAASAGDVEEVFAHDKKWGEGVSVYVLDTGAARAQWRGDG